MGVGAGRWCLGSPLNQAYGLPSLDSGARLAGNTAHFGERDVKYLINAGTGSSGINSAALQNFGSLTINIATVKAGDILECYAYMPILSSTTPGNFNAQLTYNDGATDFAVSGSKVVIPSARFSAGTYPLVIVMLGFYTVPANKTTVTVRAQASVASGSVTLDTNGLGGSW